MLAILLQPEYAGDLLHMTMKRFKAVFAISDNINCPLYVEGERMALTDRTFSCPDGKEVCLILVRDVTQLLFGLLKEEGGGKAVDTTRKYSCSGCTGLIKFVRVEPGGEGARAADSPRVEAGIAAMMEQVHGQSVDSPFLTAVPPDRIEEVIRSFRPVQVPRGKALVRQGETSVNVYLVMSGGFVVENNRQKITSLTEGNLCGEMSYLGTGPAIASVVAVKDSTVLAIRADDFARLLSDSPAVQQFMARQLAELLQQINTIRLLDFECAMRGRIADVLPAELLQVFHMHQKTGVLSLDLPGGRARVAFREGAMVSAQCRHRQGDEAVYALLAERRGYYRFLAAGLTREEKEAPELGDFMAMLMEGIRRIDESGSAAQEDWGDE